MNKIDKERTQQALNKVGQQVNDIFNQETEEIKFITNISSIEKDYQRDRKKRDRKWSVILWGSFISLLIITLILMYYEWNSI